MSIQFPKSRKEVVDRAKADVQSQLPQSNPFLKNSFLGALITGFSGRIYEFYLQLRNALLQMFPDTSTGVYLERWGSYVSVNRNPATQSTGIVNFTGTIGSTIPAGAVLSSSDGASYTTNLVATIAQETASVTSLARSGFLVTVTTNGPHLLATGMTVTVSGANQAAYNGSWNITVTAEDKFTYTIDSSPTTPATGLITVMSDKASVLVTSSNYGVVNNQESGAQLTLNVGIAGVDNIAFVTNDGLSGGTDVESDTAYRARVIFRYQNPIALFNSSAIKTQAFSVPGVTRVWVREAGYLYRTLAASSLTSSGNEATLVTVAPHSLETGQYVSIEGATPTGYNVKAKCLVLSANSIKYLIPGPLTSPATGTISVVPSVPAGQTVILFTRDDDSTAIPSAAAVAEVKRKILEIKPAHMSEFDLQVAAPIPNPVNFTFTSLVPNTVTMREAITDSLTSLFMDQTEPGVDLPQAAYLSAIWQATSVAGEQVTSFTLSTPSGTVSNIAEQLATLGTITWP